MRANIYHPTPMRRTLAAIQVLLCILFLGQSSVLAEPGESPPPPQDEKAARTLAEIEHLKINGEYNKAIELCHTAIAEFSDSDMVLREAYNYLVFITKLKGEDTSESAREALTRFPDLVAGDYFPPDQNLIYDSLRRLMYGSLVFRVEPDSSLVFLDNQFMGKAPLDIPYLTAGTYFIEVSHDRFVTHTDSISIDPGKQHVQSITLKRQGGKIWPIAAAIAAVSVVAAVIFGGSNDSPAEEPLPGPPAPPGK